MLSIQLSPNEILYCLSSDGKIDRIGTLGIPGGSIDGEIEGLQKVSREVGATLSDDVPVQLLLDTDRVCLLPSERYRSDEAATLISLQPQEETVVSAAREGITALIAVNTKLYDILKKLLFNLFTTPPGEIHKKYSGIDIFTQSKTFTIFLNNDVPYSAN